MEEEDDDTRDLHDLRVIKEMKDRKADLASLKIVLRSIVVSSPIPMTLRSLLRDYHILIRKPLPINHFGYTDYLRFIRDKCSDCFRLQGGGSNPIVSVVVTTSLPYINIRTPIQNYSNAKNKGKGKGASNYRIATVGEAEKYGSQSGRSSSSSGSLICSCSVQHRMADLLDPPGVQSSTRASSSTSSSQRSSKRAEREDPKDELHAVSKDSKDGLSYEMYPMMHYQERSTPIASLAQNLGDRLHITGNAADDDDDGDMLLQDVAAALPYPVRTEPAKCPGGDGDVGGSPSASMNNGSSAAQNKESEPSEPEVYPIDCLQFGESVPHIDISKLKPGHNIEVIVGEVYSPSHFWVIRTGPHYEVAMEELVHEITEYFEIGQGRDRFLAKDALRVGHYCVAFFNCHWHRAIIVDLIRGGELIKVRHFDYGTMAIVPPETLRPFLRCWSHLPRQALRARLAGVRPAWGGQCWSHAASEYFLRQVDERTMMARIVAINSEEAILEMFLVDMTQREDFEIARDLVESGFADVRRSSAVRITRPDDRYLYPDFSSIEKAMTPLFEKIQQYIYNNICNGYLSYSTIRPYDIAPHLRNVAMTAMFNILEPSISWPATPALQPTATSAPYPTATSARYPTATPAPYPTATSALYSTATPAPYPTATPAPYPTATSALYSTATPALYPTATSTLYSTATPVPYPTATSALYSNATLAPYPTATPAPYQTATPVPYSTATPAPYPTTRPLLGPTARWPPTTTTPVPGSPSPRLSLSPGLPNPLAMDPLPTYYTPLPPYVVSPPPAQYGMPPPPPTLGPNNFPGYPYGYNPQQIPQPSMFGIPPGSPTFPMPPNNSNYYFD